MNDPKSDLKPKSPDWSNISSDLFLRCVHCGLCTSSCPTYTELGDENDGPRGRIYLMRQVLEGRIPMDRKLASHLALCLDCRGCETACPSGVHYGHLIERFRLALAAAGPRGFDWFRETVLLRLFPYRRRLSLALWPARIAKRMGIIDWAEDMGLLRLLPGPLGELVSLLPEPVDPGPELPEIVPAEGPRRARVALFLGCVADAMFRPTHWTTVRVLARNGCEVVIPRAQTCCGAIHHHAGDSDGARRLADANIEAFRRIDLDAIVVNHAGCGAMLKEYGLYWDDHRTGSRMEFAARVSDISEFLERLGPVDPPGAIEAVATYHDACHLGHAQRIREAPRRLLARIPGLDLRPLPETEICCGSAGVYNLNQPEMANRLGHRKLEAIESTGAELVLAANAGCLLHIGREIRRARKPLLLMHPIDLLDLSYRRERLAPKRRL